MPKPQVMHPGEILAQLRAKLGLSQQDLADRAALDRRQISAIERGINKVSGYALRTSLRRALSLGGDELDELLAGRLPVDKAAALFVARTGPDKTKVSVRRSGGKPEPVELERLDGEATQDGAIITRSPDGYTRGTQGSMSRVQAALKASRNAS